MTAIAGQTHDLVIAGDGFMLAAGVKGTTNYKKALDGPASIGLTPASSGSYEALRGPLKAPVQPFRRAIWSKWSGLGQGMVAGADGWEKAQTIGKVNDLVGLRPVQDGGALALVPQAVNAQVEAGANPASQYHFITIGAVTVVSIHDRIYKSTSPGTNNSGFVFVVAAAAAVYGLGVWNGTVYVGTAANLYALNLATGVLTVAATPTARAAELITNYQTMMLVSAGSTLYWWISATGAWSAGITFESGITSLEEFDGSLYIGTQAGLYKLDGQLKAKAPSTAPTVLDWFDYKVNLIWRVIPYLPGGFAIEANFCGMVSWRGALWAFVGGQLFRIRPGTNASNLEVEAQPVVGAGRGLAVCGRWLVACSALVPSSLGRTIWVNESGNEGALGWWKLSAQGLSIYPFPNAGYTQGVINAFDTAAATTNFYRWLIDQSSPVGFRADNFGIARTAVTGKVTLPLVTPEDLAGLAGATNGKVLSVNMRRVGLEWSLIDGGMWWSGLPVDGVTLAAMQIGIEVSLDAGVNWQTLVEPTTGSLSINVWWFSGNRIELPVTSAFYTDAGMYPASPPAGPGIFFPVPDMGWLVRVTWGGLQMPLLRRVWLDYDVAEVKPQTGRGWEFEVMLGDPQIGLDGAYEVLPNDALSKAGRLWDLLVSGDSTTFTDLDGQVYRVKVAGFEQRRVAQGALPGLAAGWQGTLKLAEVWPGN